MHITHAHSVEHLVLFDEMVVATQSSLLAVCHLAVVALSPSLPHDIVHVQTKSKLDWDSYKKTQGLTDELAQGTKDG